MDSVNQTAHNVSETEVCTYYIEGQRYVVYGSSLKHSNILCHAEQDAEGAAQYVAVVIFLFAIAICVMIGMMSFKKKQYDEWDRQAGTYLTGMFKRKLQHEKKSLRNQIMQVPRGALSFAGAFAFSAGGVALGRFPPTEHTANQSEEDYTCADAEGSSLNTVPRSPEGLQPITEHTALILEDEQNI